MDKYNATGRVKKAIDIILGLLFIALLGYSFTGAPFHEVAGIVFIAMTIIHNIINIKWYKAIKKGIYNRKRKIAVAVNFALAADMASILLTGIINSRYLFHTGIHMAGIGHPGYWTDTCCFSFGRICAYCVPCTGSYIWPRTKEI